MPGVPSGRGCENCRIQKKKCDQGKPECSRCARLKVLCIGAGQQRYTFKVQLGSKDLTKRARCSATRPKHGKEKSGRKESGHQTPRLAQSCRNLLPAADYLTPMLLVQPTYSKLRPLQVLYFDRFRNQVVYQLGSQSFDDFWFRTILRESARDDCVLETILGIGALALALESAPSDIPLYKVPILGRSSSSHYADALAYFTSSLAKFRRRISSSKLEAAPRVVLISTILLSAFELLQGNSNSADQLMNNGISALKDTIMYSAWPHRQSQIAALYDDEGVEDAEFILMRRLSFRSLLLPLDPREPDIISACTLPYTEGPNPPDQKEGFQRFWKLWMRFLTLSLMWYIRAQRQGKPEGHSNADGPRMAQEQQSLLAQIKEWEFATLQKLAEEHDTYGQSVLKQIVPGIKTLRLYVEVALDDTDESNNIACITAHEIFDLADSILNDTPLFQAGLGEIYEGIQCVSLGLSRICRNADVRARAIRFGQLVVNAHSRWDAKAIMMGSFALIALEEAGRDSTGSIREAARYDWVYSSWNDDYTELNAIFRAKTVDDESHYREKQMTLRPKDFGLA